MRLSELKERVRLAFGDKMQHATPANVRDFLDGFQVEMWREEKPHHTAYPGGPYEIFSEPESISYETIIQQFFAKVLVADDEQALLLLWLLALDLAYSGIEQVQSDRLDRLFKPPSDPGLGESQN